MDQRCESLNHCVSIKYEENKRLLRQCRALHDYSIFVSRVREKLQELGRMNGLL